MRTILKLPFFAFLLTILTSPLTAEKAIELESSDGKKIKATIIRSSAGKVTIRKEGSTRDMKLSVSRFSSASQELIKKWAKENIFYSFRVQALPRQITKEGDTAEYGYDIRLSNLTQITLKDLVVKYRVYNTISEMRPGKESIGVIQGARDSTFRSVAGSRTFQKRLRPWGARQKDNGKIGNHLGGIWIRIYDAKGKKIFEWKENLNQKNKGATWDEDKEK